MSTSAPRKFRWSDVPKENVTPVIARQLITGVNAMAGMITLQKDAYVPKHSHEAEQITWVFEGRLRFVINGEEIMVGPGEVLVIPSWVEHEATAVEHTVEVDLFSPIRHDWLDGTDTYFHAGAPKGAPQKS